jgi:hypothetical protein
MTMKVRGKNVKEKIVKERNKRKDMCMCLESKRKDMCMCLVQINRPASIGLLAKFRNLFLKGSFHSY